MEDDNTQYVDMVPTDTSTNEVDEDSPIMMLFKRLLSNENKQNTVLTNAQILNILEREFHVNTKELHELEMDIYLSIMKKFLKDWPQWDEFDTAINKLKQKNNEDETRKMLVKKYYHLKNYLSIMLDIARPRAKDKIKEVEEKFNKAEEDQKKESPEDLSDVMLEIQCSRSQLNNLFFNHPHPEHNYSIFNVTESEPSKICLEVPVYHAILNWWNIAIILKTKSVHIVRSTVHEAKHTLVNTKLNKKQKLMKLKSGYQEKVPFTVKQTDLIKLNMQTLVSILKKFYTCNDNPNYKASLDVIFSVLEKDLSSLPDNIQEMVSYRKYFCRYPYVRYLSTTVPEAENDEETMKYDVHVKEVISPMYQIDISKIDPMYINCKEADIFAVQLECRSCTFKFSGEDMLEQLKQHILENHMYESDWHCMKCQQKFTMVNLTKVRWNHECN